MSGRVLQNNMLGRVYPFYLGNYNLTDSYYLYQFKSPSINSDLTPTIALTKISEKTRKDMICGHDIDILTVCAGENNEMSYLKNILKKEDTNIMEPINKNFPEIEMVDNLNIQKVMLVTLRDDLRWKNYRFYPGRKIDILWTPFEFVVFELASDNNQLWLKPVGAYKNNDVEMSNPLDVNLDELEYPKDRWDKSSSTRASDINKIIKRLEWCAFDRKALAKKL